MKETGTDGKAKCLKRVMLEVCEAAGVPPPETGCPLMETGELLRQIRKITGARAIHYQAMPPQTQPGL
jgi:hypothetical protein